MDNSLFFIFLPIFEKVVKWGSGSFQFYLLFFMNAIWSGAIQGMLLSNIRWKDLLDALRGLIEAKHFWKTSFSNRCSGIFLVESIEGWSKKQEKTSKQTSDDQTKINQSRMTSILAPDKDKASNFQLIIIIIIIIIIVFIAKR